MKSFFFTWPGGRTKSVAMTYDDGQIHDRKLVSIFNQYGIRATFHLCSCFIGRDGFVSEEEIPLLYDGHEIACHSALHVPFSTLSPEIIRKALLDDRSYFENILNRPIFGFAYPGGTASPEIARIVKECGFLYARTATHVRHWGLPEDFFLWNPSFRHDGDLTERAESFVKANSIRSLFTVCGHSYEFPQDNTWGMIESVCRILGGHDDIWYATLLEIAVYQQAVRSIHFDAACKIAWNPSAISVWCKYDGKIIEIPGGQTVSFE